VCDVLSRIAPASSDMRASIIAAGGGRRYVFPKTVWTPAGGWWNMTPPQWERNLALAFAALTGCSGEMFRNK